jgi:glycosyltransferase involved in cell wall biosynthesis
MQLSVLLPAYNEADQLHGNLLETVRTLAAAPPEMDVHSFEVILIDDGSTDDTAAIAREVSRLDARVRVVSYAPNEGKGAALRHGFECAQGSWVAFLDADLDLHPHLLFGLMRIMRDEDADVVIGSKQHPQSRIEYPLLRRIYSRSYYALVRLMFGLPVRDTQTGIKLFKREVLARAFPRMTVQQYAFDLELLVLSNADGFCIVEAPVALKSRRLNQRIKLRDIVIMFRDTLGIWRRLHSG